ncbi:MAG: DUF4317 domain-containing protein [Ruminococcaceae bacterium]|nr:DUF4317 domain-containing protein [Oscillospiraceae bacterium]
MNIKELSEIKRRFKVERTNISRIRGALINEKKEIISRFDQSLNLISEEEAEAILKTLKKVLSGSLNKNLIDIAFTNQQVLDSSEHKMLSALKASSLADDKALDELIESVRISYKSEGNYLIILGSDAYDVPSYSSDGNKKEDSGEVYSYIVCAICPLNMTKSTLGYKLTENAIKNNLPDWVIGAPDAGFLFPAFDGRKTNIYNALFYNRDKKDNKAELIEALFRREAPMAVAIQKQVFTNIFRDTIAEECSIDVVKDVQDHLGQLIEEHKALKDPEPLTVSKSTVSDILKSCGIKEEKVTEFETQFDHSFGEKATVSPENLLNVKQFEVKTPEVSIKLASDMSDLVETRVIDGQKFIMIRADGIVEVNGVEINIK